MPDVTVVVPDGSPQPPALPAVHITALGEGCLHGGKVPSLASLKEAFLQCHHGHHWAGRAASQGRCCCGLAPVPRATEARQVLGRTAGGLGCRPSGQALLPRPGQPGWHQGARVTPGSELTAPDSSSPPTWRPQPRPLAAPSPPRVNSAQVQRPLSGALCGAARAGPASSGWKERERERDS